MQKIILSGQLKAVISNTKHILNQKVPDSIFGISNRKTELSGSCIAATYECRQHRLGYSFKLDLGSVMGWLQGWDSTGSNEPVAPTISWD